MTPIEYENRLGGDVDGDVETCVGTLKTLVGALDEGQPVSDILNFINIQGRDAVGGPYYEEHKRPVAPEEYLAAGNASEILAGLRWAIRQLQGESGASHSYWVEIPEYQAALKVLTVIEEGGM